MCAGKAEKGGRTTHCAETQVLHSARQTNSSQWLEGLDQMTQHTVSQSVRLTFKHTLWLPFLSSLPKRWPLVSLAAIQAMVRATETASASASSTQCDTAFSNCVDPHNVGGSDDECLSAPAEQMHVGWWRAAATAAEYSPKLANFTVPHSVSQAARTTWGAFRLTDWLTDAQWHWAREDEQCIGWTNACRRQFVCVLPVRFQAKGGTVQAVTESGLKVMSGNESCNVALRSSPSLQTNKERREMMEMSVMSAMEKKWSRHTLLFSAFSGWKAAKSLAAAA